MTLPQRSRNDQRLDRNTHIAHKIKASNSLYKREMRNFDNALRSRDLSVLVDDPLDAVDLNDLEYP